MRNSINEGTDMNKHHEVRFTHPLSYAETKALEAEGRTIPDWSDSITRASAAVREMEDALPGNNKARSVAGLLALEQAAKDIRSFLEYRKAL
jgi:hypothetical protein